MRHRRFFFTLRRETFRPYVYRSTPPAAQLPEPTLKMRHRRIFFTLRRETFPLFSVPVEIGRRQAGLPKKKI
jgi:hypothetical protein